MVVVINKYEDRHYCVYVHISPSGKMYIGQTGQKPERRWKNGAGYLSVENGKYKQPMFAHAILKYGWDNFQHEIIANNLTKEEADSFEKLLIEKFDTINDEYGYNCREGGSNGGISEEARKKISNAHKGSIVSDDTKRKISESLKGENHYLYGKHLTDETKKKLSDAHKGRSLSEDHKRKIGEAIKGENHPMYGKQHTEESKQKMSESHKGLLAGSKHPNARKVIQYDLDGKFIKVWDYIGEVEIELKIKKQSICNCCNGRCKTAGGFIWKYYEDVKTA